MKSLPAIAFAVVLLCRPALGADDATAIGRVLDRLHEAAAQAQFEPYFSLFVPDGVFIGTDAGERWTVPQFKAYAKPHFDRGTGWTYVATTRNITVSPDGRHAFFDELLDHASYGRCRGTGVLWRVGAEWKIAQYHLTIPVPNELAGTVVKLIRNAK
jgi:hypothetical protein